ncbi:MAG: hypothetical protein MZV70_61320 [Desulfobacterales bacterium]|nr:hypothetical protein [Desulfobacterales bacterium]
MTEQSKEETEKPYRIRFHLSQGPGGRRSPQGCRHRTGRPAMAGEAGPEGQTGESLPVDAGRCGEVQELHELLRLHGLQLRPCHGRKSEGRQAGQLAGSHAAQTGDASCSAGIP